MRRSGHQTDVLASQRQAETGGLELLAGNDAAVIFVDRAGKDAVAEEADQRFGVDAILFAESKGFRHGLDRRADHEVAGEFDDVGGAGVGAEIGNLLAECFQQRSGLCLAAIFPGAADPQLAGLGRYGAAKNRSGEIGDAGLPMLLCEAACGRRQDRTHRDMHAAGFHCRQEPCFAQRDVVDRTVVGHHGEHDVGRCYGLAGGFGSRCTQGDERVTFAEVTVPYGQRMAGCKKPFGHGGSHIAESEIGDGEAHCFLLERLAAMQAAG